jgi:serine/alanine adding enzyme
MRMETTILTSPSRDCESFVLDAPAAKICHTFDWSQMLTRRLGYETYYLVAREAGEIRGVMPLTRVHSRLFGNRMICQAFSNYGGGIATDSHAMGSMFAKARELALQQRCSSIEFRSTEMMPHGLRAQTGKVCMYLQLSQDPDVMWHGFRSEIRNRVNKARKNNLVASEGGLELMDDFYNVYVTRMHELGTPCYPRQLMESVLKTFPDNTRLFVVRHGNKPIGAAFTFQYKGFAEIPWVATVSRYNGLAPNNLLYWTVISYYCRAGVHTFDFGRSSFGGATYEFKRRWGARAVDLHYQYWVAPNHQLSMANPENPRYRWKVELWKRLPLWVTRQIGPLISAQLP